MAETYTLYEKMATFEEKQNTMSRDISEIKQSVRETNNYIQSMEAINDNKYAAKRIENIFDNGIWIILSFIILAVLTFLFKKKQ